MMIAPRGDRSTRRALPTSGRQSDRSPNTAISSTASKLVSGNGKAQPSACTSIARPPPAQRSANTRSMPADRSTPT